MKAIGAWGALLSLERTLKIATDHVQKRLDKCAPWTREQSLLNGRFISLCWTLDLVKRRISKIRKKTK